MRRAPILVILTASLFADSLSELAPPLEGLRSTDLRDMFDEVHNGHPHHAIDIARPTGTPVHAVVSGSIAKLFLSKAGGNTIYEFDADGNYCYYYAHLDRYADRLREGARVEKGDVIGFVGSTGNAVPEAPHLHFAVTKLGPQKQWWKGDDVNPFEPLRESIARSRPR